MPPARKIAPSPAAFQPAAAIAPEAAPVSLLHPPPHTPPGMVTAHALVFRINRKLASARQRIGQRQQGASFRYVLIDRDTRRVLETHVNLEARARQLGCLKPGERIA